MRRSRSGTLMATCAVVVATLAAMWWLAGGDGSEHGAVLGSVAGARDAVDLHVDDTPREASRDTVPPVRAPPDGAPEHLATPADPALSGHVVDAHAAPIAGARVRAARVRLPETTTGSRPLPRAVELEHLGPVHVTRGDAAGRWSLDLPADERPRGDAERLVLCFDAPGLRRRVVMRDRAGDVGTVTLAPGASVTGRLVDEGGHPFADARVWIEETGRPGGDASHPPVEGWTSVTTRADGRFTSAAVAAGDARLVIDGPCVPRSLRVASLPAGTTDVGDVAVFVGGTLTGVVRDATGAPVADARVFVAHVPPYALDHHSHPAITVDAPLATHQAILERHDHGTVTTDAAGRFEVAGVPHRDVRVTAESPPLGVAPRRTTLTASIGHVELTLPTTTPLTLRVVAAEDGRALPFDTLDVEATAVSAVVAATDEIDGPSVPVVATADTATVWRPSSLGTRLRVSAPDRRPERRVVPPDETEITVTLARAGAVEGRVVGAEGRASVPVEAMNLDTGARASTYARGAEDGAFRLAPLAAGRWDVVADTGRGAFGRAVVDVAEGAVVRDVVVPIGPGGDLVVDIVSDEPRRVSLSATHGASTADRRMGHARDEVTWRGMLPGTWRVEGAGVQPIEVEIRPDETTTAEVHAQAAPRVVGYVTSDGAPVTSGRVGVGHAWTDVAHDGSFALAVGDAGDHVVTWRGDAGLWLDAAFARCRWGETTVHALDVPSDPGVDVLVVDAATGEPLGGAPILGHATTPTPLGSTGEDGHLRVAPFPAGRDVSVDVAQGWLPATAAATPDAALVLRTRRVGSLSVRPTDEFVTAWTYTPLDVTLHLVSTTTGERLVIDTRAHETVGRIPTGTWRLVAVPAWRDVDAVPPGAGTLVEIRRGERTTVEVPLSY